MCVCVTHCMPHQVDVSFQELVGLDNTHARSQQTTPAPGDAEATARARQAAACGARPGTVWMQVLQLPLGMHARARGPAGPSGPGQHRTRPSGARRRTQRGPLGLGNTEPAQAVQGAARTRRARGPQTAHRQRRAASHLPGAADSASPAPCSQPPAWGRRQRILPTGSR